MLTLFLVFINNIIRDLPHKDQGAIYVNDLILGCSGEQLSTANYRLQQALKILERWTKQWLVKINPRKITFTIFSLSTREQNDNLYNNDQTAC